MITAQQYIYNSKKENCFVTSLKHSYSSSNGKKVGKDGDVYILLNISSEKNFDPNRFSRFVLDSILDGYLYSNSKSANESVKDAVNDGVNKIKELIKNDKDLSTTGIDVSFTITVFKKEGAYIGNLGENDIYLFKKGELVNIGEIIAQKKATTVGIVLKEQDILIVSTKEKITENLVKMSRIKIGEDILKFLKLLGESLNLPSGFIFFKTEVSERTPKILEEKVIETKKEKITEEKEVVKRKIDILKYIPKVKIPKDIFSKLKPVTQFLTSIFSKIGKLFQKLYDSIQEFVLSKLRNKRWFKKLGSKMSEIKIPGGQIRREGMRIDEYKVKGVRGKRVRIILVSFLILLLLALGINFTITKKKERETSNYANERFEQIEDFLSKVENTWRTDKSGAETYLFKSEKLFEEIPANLLESDSQKQKDLHKRYVDLGDMLYRRVGVSESIGNMTKYLESRLAFGEGSNPTDIDIYTDKSGNEFLMVSDKDKNTVYRVALYDKSVKSLPDDEKVLVDPTYISVGVNGVYAFDSKVGMVTAQFDDSGWFKTFTALSGLSVDDLKTTDISEMIVLTDTDNVYLLARDLKAVLKSTLAYGTRYGLSYAYLEKEEFSQGNDIFSDLSVYVTTSLDPKLVRYNYSYVEQKQAEASLSVGGFDGNYGNLTKGFTRVDMNEGLYIFDSEGKRIFKFEKPLESGEEILHPDQIVLLGQYLYRGETQDVWSNVKDIVVDQKEENMYVLDGSVIWKISL